MTETPYAWERAAAALAEALPLMRRYGGAVVVIKFGGHAMRDEAGAGAFAGDIALLRQAGALPVVVHGGGPQIDALLARLGIVPKFRQGLRITDAITAQAVEMALAGEVGKNLARIFTLHGAPAVSVSGKDAGLIEAEPLGSAFGQVGRPKKINRGLLDALMRGGLLPIVAPVGQGPNGETMNVNADAAAGAIAGALGAARMVMLTDVPGVLDEQGALIPSMDAAQARAMLASGVVRGGMGPKITACLDALDAGVEAAVIIDGRRPHALLGELYTRHGAGTLITPSAASAASAP